MPFVTPTHLKDEKRSDKITVVFGRFQPPTLGHKMLFDTAIQNAILNQTDVLLVATNTCPVIKKSSTSSKRSFSSSESYELCSKVRYPLTYAQKKELLQQLYPDTLFSKYRFLDMTDSKIHFGETEYNLNLYRQLLAFLNRGLGYKELYFVAGDDRVDSFQEDILKSNGTDYEYHIIHDIIDVGKNRSGEATKRLSVTLMSEEVEVSGTIVRMAAVMGLQRTFHQAVTTGSHFTMEDSKDLMMLLRKAMKIPNPLSLATIDESNEKKLLMELKAYLQSLKEPSISKKQRVRGGFYLGYVFDLFRR